MTCFNASSRPVAARLAQVLVLAALLPFTACNAGAQDQAASPPAADAAPRAVEPDGTAPASDAPSADEYTITIGSEPFAGTHRGGGEMNCFSQDGTWGADLTIERPRGVTNILVMVTGVPAGGGSTEDVNLGLTFGQIDDESANAGSLGIGAASGGGSGRAVVERAGEGTSIRIEGTTHYGAPITAIIRCQRVG